MKAEVVCFVFRSWLMCCWLGGGRPMFSLMRQFSDVIVMRKLMFGSRL